MDECRDNPFPSTAVARLSAGEADRYTVQTEALATALTHVDDYLGSTHRTNAGKVLAVTGDYGSGKTHLATELLWRIRVADAHEHTFYLEAANSFGALYRERFLPRLRRDDLRERIEEYFIEIVADELSRSPLTSRLATAMREKEIAPTELVEQLVLPSALLQERLQETLSGVTEDSDFGAALALFLRPEFEDAVWEWLEGNEPDPSLRERGIVQRLDSEARVLEALGVFAALYCHGEHRFVLVVDELEKLLAGPAPAPARDTVLALKRLMEVMTRAGALLVLVGLPDFLDALSSDARQRISAEVRVSGLTADETANYIRGVLPEVDDGQSLKPFSPATARYLSELAGGNARKVVRLCHYAWRAATDGGTDVTPAMLREVVREQFENATAADIEVVLTRIIDMHGWQFERAVADKRGTFDYWISVGSTDMGCGIVVTRSVLQPADVRRLRRTLRRRPEATPALLIVNGGIADGHLATLERLVTRVLQYRDREFADDAEAALVGLVSRVEEAVRASAQQEQSSALIFVRDRVEQLGRQNQSLHNTIGELAQTTVGPGEIESAVERGLRRVFAAVAEGGATQQAISPRFRATAVAIDEAERSVAAVQAEIDGLLVGALAERPGVSDAWARVVGLVALLGYVQVARKLLASFTDDLSRLLPRLERHDDAIPICRRLDDGWDRFEEAWRAGSRRIDFNLDPPSQSIPHRLDELSVRMRELGREVYRALDHDLQSLGAKPTTRR